MRVLAIIPARGGSKGLPGKNIKPLCGKPLIGYSIDVAREVLSDSDICVSTDDDKIIEVVRNMGLKVHFVRPSELASDIATTNDVLIHAIEFYKTNFNKEYDAILLLQPTSPLRTVQHIKDVMELYQNNSDCDMVVSVKESHSASVMCHENEFGLLQSSLTNAQRRQDVPKFYEYNGAIYLMNVASLKNKGIIRFDKKIKYVMPNENSVDIDNMFDWNMVELLIQQHHNKEA